ncbi:MAG TPA: heterodisulfide reductase-related iron-sulfur binding cluster [Candidatus Baltobacteraceae bacterium]
MIEAPLHGFTGTDSPSAAIYDQCVRCGLCLPTCPTYLETMTETSGPRGRISLIKSVAEGHLDLLSPGFVHQMSECLDCRACEAVCPSGVRYGQLIETARAQIDRAQSPTRSPSIRLLRWFGLRVLFSRPATMRAFAALLRFYQRSGLRSLVRASGALRLLGLAEAERFAPTISDRPFAARGQSFPVANAKCTVFFHVGCVMHVAFAQVNEASVRVLGRAGCSVVIPAAQGCCGAIGVHAGDIEFGRELAKRNIAAFEASGADFYVVNAAGCGSALKEYGTLFAEDARWASRAAAFSTRVRDILELLDAVGIDPRLGRIDRTITYQEPCHLAHAQRITAAPRRLLARIPGLQLIEMAESSVCCGSAGIYNVTEPEMAGRLRHRKIANATATNAEICATANPGCALQMETGLREAGSEMAIKHVVELIDESYAAYSAAATRS